MKKLIKTSLLIALLAMGKPSFSQIIGNDTATTTGSTVEVFAPAAAVTPFDDVKYLEAQGNPYFDYNWEQATVVTKAGLVYKNIPIRIDLVANKIHLKSEAGKALVIGTALKEVKYQTAAGKLVHFVHGDYLPNKKPGWFQVLVNDSVSLVKGYRKMFEERASYGGNQINIKTTENYFVFYNGTEHPVKKPADLIELFPAKKSELEAGLKNLKSLAREEQLTGLVDFINRQLKN